VKYSAIHPRTPDPYEESSKRQFDGRIKAWRRELHKWDSMEQIAQVELQVERAAAPQSGQMDGVAATGAPPLVVSAPLGVPSSRAVPAKTAAVASKGGSKDALPRGGSAYTGAEGGSDEEEEEGLGRAAKRSRLADGEDEAALDGVNYDWGGEGASRDGFPPAATTHGQQQEQQEEDEEDVL
jgi:hypothetical protein